MLRRDFRGVALVAIVAVACGSESSGGAGSAPPPPEPTTCAVPGVAGARPVERVELPPSCSFVSGGSESAPRVLRTAEELAAALRCEPATAAPTIDMTANDLYVVTLTISPATAGNEALDDGTAVTFVTRFRQSCPNDPMPMPMQSTVAFRLPKGATRTFRSANCTIPRRCS